MAVQNINIQNNSPVSLKSKQTSSFTENGSVPFAWKDPNQTQKPSTKVKMGVLLTTLAGIGAAMAITLKGKGYSVNPKRLFKTNPKNWAIFHINYSKNENDYDIEKLVGKLAVGSVGGGLIGGALFDKKENMKAKYRESIIQMVGNILTPLLFVSGGTRLFEKVEPKVIKQLKLNGKIAMVPKIIVSAACLVAAIFTGNKIGNNINQKVFHVKEDRKIKLADMSPHIDDMCLATSLIAKDINFVPRLIPLALTIAGVSTGTAQEKHNNLQKTN